eukprot:7378703-Prymnesium_polylepis.1
MGPHFQFSCRGTHTSCWGRFSTRNSGTQRSRLPRCVFGSCGGPPHSGKREAHDQAITQDVPGHALVA